MKKEKSFPTIIGLIFLIASIFGGVYLTSTSKNIFTKASGDCRPDNLQITNLTHQSATVSFVTSSPCLSNISVDNRTIVDTRFQVTSTQASPVKIHYFQIFDLQQNRPYSFSVISGGKTFSETTYKFTTATLPSGEIPQSNLAWGKVLSPDLSPATNAILYLNIPGASPLSSYITSQGNWNISFAYSFNEAKNNWFQPPAEGIEEDIIVISDDGSPTQIANFSLHNNPVPDIIIGQNFLTQTDTSQSTGQLPSTDTSVQSQKSLDVLNPKDGEILNTARPQFFGSAPGNSEIIITVESPQTFTGQVTSSTSGDWNWSLPDNLTPGEHTITVKTQNPISGVWETIQRKFVVMAASGDNLAFSATPSATTVPTFAPTQAPTLIPTTIPTAIPTTPPRTSHPSTESGVPVTGNAYPTIIIGLFALISFILARRFF